MRVYLSYRFTGERKQDLIKTLSPVINKLNEIGLDAYCNFFDKDLPSRSKNYKQHDFVFDAYKIIDTTDLIFVLINSENKSEGMILELGYGIAKKIPVIVAIKDGVNNTYLPGMANLIIHYKDIGDLVKKIPKINFCSIKNK